MAAAETPGNVVDTRLGVAASVAAELAGAEPVVTALVVGSTALRRCSPSADLDLVVVTDRPPGRQRFCTRWVDGMRVEIERLSRRRSLAATRGDGWVWQLREAARLGTGLPVLDPTGFGARLGTRAAAMAPSPDRYEATLRAVYLALMDLAGQPDGSLRADRLRGCLDNLALLALLERPRRYQKPKWVLADLLHAGEDGLAEALLAAYGTGDALDAARSLVDAVYAAAGVPPHDEVLAMGYAPRWAEASYVSRTLDDAEDLLHSGRVVEAAYVARFAARLAGGLLGGPGGLVEAFAARELDGGYLALFEGTEGAGGDLLAAALAAADGRRHTMAA